MTKMSHQRISVGEELGEINEKIIAMGGASEFTGVEWPTPDTPRYLFASTSPMIGHVEALAYMKGKLQAAEKAALGKD